MRRSFYDRGGRRRSSEAGVPPRCAGGGRARGGPLTLRCGVRYCSDTRVSEEPDARNGPEEEAA